MLFNHDVSTLLHLRKRFKSLSSPFSVLIGRRRKERRRVTFHFPLRKEEKIVLSIFIHVSIWGKRELRGNSRHRNVVSTWNGKRE